MAYVGACARSSQADKSAVSALDVDAHMHEKWDRVLTYLVEPRSSAKVGLVASNESSEVYLGTARDGNARGVQNGQRPPRLQRPF
jgi:hypothetical protein